MARSSKTLRWPWVRAASVSLALTTFASAQFETRAIAPVVLNPRSVAVGDFNHDGKLDMAVASLGTNTQDLTILLGNGDGTFKPGVYYNVSNGLFSVATADFNRDGNLDLVVADYYSGNVSVLMGNGDGTFKSAVTYAVPPGPKFVLTGDFNGDHWPDIVALEVTGNCDCVSVLLNNRDGTFQAAKTTPAVSGSDAIGVGDFNRDGRLDVVTAGQSLSGASVNILLGNGDGTFTPGASYPVDNVPVSVVVADFRGTGLLDLAAAEEFGGVVVLLGNGDGTFQPPVTYSAVFPSSLAVADFNGDGKPDMAVADTASPQGSVTVLLGNGDGTFLAGVSYPVGKDPLFVTTGDFNGDKKADLVTANDGNNTAGVLLNTGVVTFSPTTPLNFKKQTVGTTSPPQTVTLTNSGSTALTISSMKSTGQFGMSSTCGTSVAPGANCAINVTFSPQSKGPKSGTVTLRDSASSKPQVIELSGTGD